MKYYIEYETNYGWETVGWTYHGIREARRELKRFRAANPGVPARIAEWR